VLGGQGERPKCAEAEFEMEYDSRRSVEDLIWEPDSRERLQSLTVKNTDRMAGE
jgi:hypothetical protein